MGDTMDQKPRCGGGEPARDYDVGIHVMGLFLVVAASLVGAGFPVAAKKVAWIKVPARVFFLCKHFGTGVLIATAFVHLIPTAFASLGDPCLPDFFTTTYAPFPGGIMMVSMFLLFTIEMWLNDKAGGHSHGGAMGFDGGHGGVRGVVGVRGENSGKMDHDGDFEDNKAPAVAAVSAGGVPGAGAGAGAEAASPYIDVETGRPVPYAVYRKMSTNIALLEGGILFHSVFVGMTVSITVEGFVVLLVAVLFHQMFEGLGIGSRIAAVPYPCCSARPWLLVVAFGLTAPLGQAIGLLTRNTYDPNSALGLIIVGVFNAISSGLLIYAALVDLLAEDFLSQEAKATLTRKDKRLAFLFVILGAIGMAVVGAFA